MFGYGFDSFGTIGRWWRDFNQQPSMYEVGKYFLSHKMIIKRNKNKFRLRKGKKC